MTDKSHKPRLILRGEQPRTTSLAVAEFFEKEHFHVLRDIQRILADLQNAEFGSSNFGLVKETIRACGHYASQMKAAAIEMKASKRTASLS